MKITRRDFVNGALIGSGAALLGFPAPAAAQVLDASWTGYAGIGDYARSNGNTATVVNHAHAMRDGRYDDAIAQAKLVDDIYDLVVVGGGFAGLGATYDFKKAMPNGRVLLIENHPVPGGEAKQNVIEIDGLQLIGPQGSNGTLAFSAENTYPIAKQYWTELSIPHSFEFVQPAGAAANIRVARDNYESMFWDEKLASTGWFFPNGQMVVDPFTDRLARAPLPETTKRDWLAWHDHNAPVPAPPGTDVNRWLDSMSYGDYITNVMGLGTSVFQLADPLVSAGDYGVSATAISAYAAKLLGMPGPAGATGIGYDESLIFSFPGGNATIARYIFKALVPDGIAGDSFSDIAGGAFDFTAFDRPGANVRVRVGSTAVAVKHHGTPESAQYVDVAYVRTGGEVERVRARSVVMAGGGWVNKHVVRDLPPEFHDAYAQFHHAPILVANVGLRNWRAMASLGISALRWFEGLGFFANIRQPMRYPGYDVPLDPDKPTILTFYVGFPQSGTPLGEQATLGRVQMLTTSYAQYETILRRQLQAQLGHAGFDHTRDIAAIVLNRWGHAYIAPQPGFYFNANGGPGPASVIQRGYGRIFFGHSELSGRQNWPHALSEGTRATSQALEVMNRS